MFDAVLPIFQAMGKTITLLGPLGSGGFTKLANQIIVAVNLTALGEALTLGQKAGLDRALTLKALAGGLAGSRCLDQKTPNYVAGTYKPGFKIDLHFKDLGPDHGVGSRPRRAAARDGRRPGAVQRAARQGRVVASITPGSSRCWKTSRASLREGDRRPRRPRLARALLQGPDPADPQGRSLASRDVLEQTFARFLRAPARHAPPPAVRGRAVRASPLAHGALGLLRRRGGQQKIVGAALAVTWGAVGLLGPVAVFTQPPEPGNRPAARRGRAGASSRRTRRRCQGS